jgi:hypothetical protein
VPRAASARSIVSVAPTSPPAAGPPRPPPKNPVSPPKNAPRMSDSEPKAPKSVGA